MKIYDIIVEDDNGKLYSLDSPYMNENFIYDEQYDTLTEIKKEGRPIITIDDITSSEELEDIIESAKDQIKYLEIKESK
tara:strand:+ start:5976 stop:6212 length:237 start_codon:yes stop_codon:yes gene_type:complete